MKNGVKVIHECFYRYRSRYEGLQLQEKNIVEICCFGFLVIPLNIINHQQRYEIPSVQIDIEKSYA